jgi:hypothetical protein
VHLDITKVFRSPTDALLLVLENTKIYIKTHIKIAPTCFSLRPSSGGLQLSLAKVTLMLKQSVKLRHYVLCGGVAACYVQVWCVCCAEASLKCKLPDDGRRPKHVGAILIQVLM